MNRMLRIIGGCSIAVTLWLLLPSCATVPGREITLEAARHNLQTQYPELLQTFDLHQGIFAVNQAAWDTLAPARRTAFLNRCSRSRWEITGRKKISVRTDGDLLATYDGANTVCYGDPAVAAARADANLADSAPAVGAKATPVAVLVSLPRPIYPPDALRAGVEGTVFVLARIDAEGWVQETQLVDGGIAMLNVAAIEAVRHARFRPMAAAPELESLWLRIPMHFAILGIQPKHDPRAEGNVGGLVNMMEPTMAERAPAGSGVK